MTTRREFIKILTGTVIVISLPMGLINNKEEVVKIPDVNDITWDAVTGANITHCSYYAPQVTIIVRDYKIGETVPYVDLWANPNCGKCIYNKHRPRCIEMFNS